MRELTLDKLPRKVLADLDIETVFIASRCVIAAEQLQVFRKLHGRELSAATLARRIGLRWKHSASFFDCLVYLGLLKKTDNKYRNSPLAAKHFIAERSMEWTRLWSHECAQDYEALTALEEVLSTGRDWREILGKERKPDYELVQEDPVWARGFAFALYDIHQAEAELLARHLDLSGYRTLLDVGGGSGVMSIALARAHPHLRACVMDFEYVCAAAKDIIRREGLSRRVRTLAGDMNERIPSGFDVMLFWDIGRIDARVMKMAYDNLPRGGMIVRSCPRPSRSKVVSPSRFLHQYASVRPEGQSKASKLDGLKSAGFSKPRYRSIGQGYGVISGHKG